MRVRTIFCSSELSGHLSELEVYANDKNEIYISISESPEDPFRSQFIALDRDTAIKFSKVLRKEISALDKPS
jgi:hypothetical protein